MNNITKASELYLKLSGCNIPDLDLRQTFRKGRNRVPIMKIGHGSSLCYGLILRHHFGEEIATNYTGRLA